MTAVRVSARRDSERPWMVSRRIFGQLVFFTLLLLSAGLGTLAGLVFVYSSDLPQVRELEDYQPDVMTELYADNGVSLGQGEFGFEAAAQFYFGKHIGDLTLSEAALLAGLPKTPTAYSPLLHPERAVQRRNQVLLAMIDNHKISREEYEHARAAPLG